MGSRRPLKRFLVHSEQRTPPLISPHDFKKYDPTIDHRSRG